MPKLVTDQQGWPHFQKLLIALLRFLEPYLRNAELTDSVRLLYKGTLRVLLVLLHDFPEFLCEYHFEVHLLHAPRLFYLTSIFSIFCWIMTRYAAKTLTGIRVPWWHSCDILGISALTRNLFASLSLRSDWKPLGIHS